MIIQKSIRRLKPSQGFGPVPFWFLDHDLEDKELIRQIQEMKDKGLAGFFIVPWDGLTIPYLSEKWFDKVGTILKESKRIGMKAWLYDTIGYPSGEAGGKIAFDHPEYTRRDLKIVEKKIKGRENLSMKLPDGKIIKVMALKLKNGKIDPKKMLDITNNVGIIRDKWQAGIYKTADTPYGPFYSSGQSYPHWRAEQTEHFYQIDWDVPSGEWLVMGFIECFVLNNRIDLLNPDAVKYFLEVTHEQYWKRFKNHFGRTIPGIFADEPQFTSWTPKLLKTFRDEKKYNLEDYLPALKYDIGDITPKIRCDYRDILLKLFNESYIKPTYNWCNKHGIEFTGHLSPEEEPICAVYLLSDLMPILKSFHIPGTDVLFHFTGEKEHAIRNIAPKLVSSVAHQTGREKVLCEAFALINWEDTTIEKMKIITDWLFVLGINMLNPHAFYYSIDGYRKRSVPCSQFYQSTYWPFFKFFSDYVSRLSCLLRGGKHIADIAILYPTSTLWSLLPCDMKSPLPEQAFFIRDYLILLNDILLRIHRDFDYLDEKTLADAAIKKGGIYVGEECYSVLVLPPLETISEITLKRIEEFYKQGGTLLAFESLPFNSKEKGSDVGLKKKMAEIFACDFQRTNKKGIRVLQNFSKNGGRTFFFTNGMNNRELLKDKLKKVLDQSRAADVSIESPANSAEDIFYLHRRKEGENIYFFANISDTSQKVTMSFKKAKAKPYLFNPGSAETINCSEYANKGRICIDYTFEKRESLFVIFGKRTSDKLHTSFSNKIPHRDKNYKETILSSNWKFKTEKQNMFLVQNWRVKVDTADKSEKKAWHAKAIDAAYTNMGNEGAPYPYKTLNLKNSIQKPLILRYKSEFYTEGKIHSACLVMERSAVKGEYEIWVNGHKLSNFKRVREYDTYNITTEIQDYLKTTLSRSNIIAIKVNVTEDDDGLLEPPIIMGDFIVSSDNCLKSLYGENARTVKAGSWTEQGCPYYSGRGIYEQYLDITPEYQDKEVWLEFEKAADLIEVLINNHTAGVICWPPYRMRITEFLKCGKNKLTLKITNSLANMLEGKKRESGLIGKVKLIVCEKENAYI